MRVAGESPNTVYSLSKILASRPRVSESKSGRTLIIRSPQSTTSNAQAGRLFSSWFFLANSTGCPLLLARCPSNAFLSWRCNVLSAKPRLRQNSFCRNPLASNSTTGRLISSLLRRFRAGISCFAAPKRPTHPQNGSASHGDSREFFRARVASCPKETPYL